MYALSSYLAHASTLLSVLTHCDYLDVAAVVQCDITTGCIMAQANHHDRGSNFNPGNLVSVLAATAESMVLAFSNLYVYPTP